MSTFEILIALTVFTLSITSVVFVVFGNQSAAVDAELNRSALGVARAWIEEERSLARRDFNLVVPTSTVVRANALEYAVSVAISPLELFAKQATTTVRWEVGGEKKSVILSSFFTDREAFSDSDTCSSLVSGDWARPILTISTLMSLVATTTGPYSISDIDVYRSVLYLAVAKTPYRSDPTLFIFDITDSSHPTLLGKLDNATTTTNGLSALRVAEDPVRGERYLYAASISSFASGQLQVFDVTDSSHPRLLTTYKVPSAIVPTAGLGNSLAYKNGYVYLGLTATSGREFNIIDVQNPTAPLWKGGYALGGHDVNAIVVRDDYAYVATPATEEVVALDVKNPFAPTRVGGFNASVWGGNGKILYAVGTTLYLGKTVPNAGPEYYALDVSQPAGIQGASARAITREIGSSVNGLFVRDYLSFILTNTALLVINATSTTQLSLTGLPASGSSYEPSLDCEGNTLYASSNDVSGNGSLSIFSAP